MKKATRAKLKREAAVEAQNESMPIGHTPISIAVMTIFALLLIAVIGGTFIGPSDPDAPSTVIFAFFIFGIPFCLAWASRAGKKRAYLKERERDIYEKKCLEQEEEADDED